MKKTRVQKMYKRFKNRVLRRKGVEENQERLPRQQLKLISSEPLTDLRTVTSPADAAAPPSSHSISRLSFTVQSATDNIAEHTHEPT